VTLKSRNRGPHFLAIAVYTLNSDQIWHSNPCHARACFQGVSHTPISRGWSPALPISGTPTYSLTVRVTTNYDMITQLNNLGRHDLCRHHCPHILGTTFVHIHRTTKFCILHGDQKRWEERLYRTTTHPGPRRCRADSGSHFMTHDPRDPSVNWPVTPVTRDPWLTTTHQSLSQCDFCLP